MSTNPTDSAGAPPAPSARAAKALRDQRDALAAEAVRREFEERPELLERYGEAGRKHCLGDVGRHLDYLTAAVEQRSTKLFQDYVSWAAVVLDRLDIDGEELRANLTVLRGVLHDQLPPDVAAEAVAIVDEAIAGLQPTSATPETFLGDPDTPLGRLARKYLQALLSQNRVAAADMIMEAVDSGVPVRDVYLGVFQPVQYEVGRLWQIGEVSVAEEHYCTAATQLVMSRLYPLIFSTESNGRSMIAACVGGDLHEIGLRMVADFFQMEGWDTVFLGANTPLASLVDMVEERRPDLVAISSTMTFHVNLVAEIIAEIRARAPEVHILVGGYPFAVDEDLWRTIGADGTAADAQHALAQASRLTGGEDHAA